MPTEDKAGGGRGHEAPHYNEIEDIVCQESLIVLVHIGTCYDKGVEVFEQESQEAPH